MDRRFERQGETNARQSTRILGDAAKHLLHAAAFEPAKQYCHSWAWFYIAYRDVGGK